MIVQRVAGRARRPRATGSAVRPSAVTLSDGATPSCVWPPTIGRSKRAARRRAGRASTRSAWAASRAPSASSAATGAAPIAERSCALTSIAHQPAHSGSCSTIDGQDRVGARDDVRAGDRRAVVAAPAVARQQRVEQVAERLLRPVDELRRSAGSASASRRAARPATSTSRRRAPSRACAKKRSWRSWTCASKRSAPRSSATAQAARTSAAPTAPRRTPSCALQTRRLPFHQPRPGCSGSGCSRTPPTTSPPGRRRRARRRRGARRGASRSWPANRPCCSTNARRRSAVVAGEQARVVAGVADREGRRGRAGTRGGAASARRRAARPRPAERDRWPSHGAHPPAACSAEQAPHAAQPATWSAPRMPGERQRAPPTRRVTSTSVAGSGAGTPSACASEPCERAVRARRTGRRPSSIEPAGAGDELVRVLAEADEQVRRDAVGAEDARPRARHASS